MPKVLVVDDDEALAAMISEVLEAAGFDVIETGDGQSALELARAYRPDVVVADILMPRMHGWELCKRLRTEPTLSGVKILVLSVKCYPADERTSLAVGADLFMKKPADLADLVSGVGRLAAADRRN